MNPFRTEKWQQACFFLKTVLRRFWKECYVPAIGINVVIEMLSRESVWEAFLYVIKTPIIFFYNAMIIAVSLSVSLFFKRRRFVQILFCIIWLGIGVVDFVLLQFRTTPFSFVDILLLDSAIAIAWHYLTGWQIGCIILAFGLVAVGCVYLFMHLPKEKKPVSRAGWGIFCAFLFLITIGFTRLGVQVQLLEGNFGNIAQAFHTNGLPYCFVNSVFGMGIDKPEDYSDETVQEIVDALEEKTVFSPQPTLSQEFVENALVMEEASGDAENALSSAADSVVSDVETSAYPNVIFLQLESFFDPTLINGAEFTADPVPVFRWLKENHSSGYLRVPSFGAGTANTEFEILTGMNLDFFGPGEYPYKTILKDISCENLAFNLSALGLRPHAIHNNDATFYGRNHIFSQFGFSTFIALEYMEEYETTPLGWAKDACLTNEILGALQSTTEQDFIYTISVQGHGAYPEEAVLAEPVVDLTLPEELQDSYYPLLYYVNQLYEMDLFLKQLLYVLDAYSEDVVLVLYGDHLPTFPFTEESMKNGSVYETEYVVWSNFPMEREQLDLQAYQLSAYVLGRLGIQEGLLTKYHQAELDEIRKKQSIANLETENALDENFSEEAEELVVLNEERETYLENLQILEYDMLYGNMDCYNGKNPYQPSKLQLGLHTIAIHSAVLRDNANAPEESVLYVRGEHFTKFSVVYLDGEPMETFYINNSTLYVKVQEERKEPFTVVVKQVGKDGAVLSETPLFVSNG